MRQMIPGSSISAMTRNRPFALGAFERVGFVDLPDQPRPSGFCACRKFTCPPLAPGQQRGAGELHFAFRVVSRKDVPQIIEVASRSAAKIKYRERRLTLEISICQGSYAPLRFETVVLILLRPDGVQCCRRLSAYRHQVRHRVEDFPSEPTAVCFL